MNFFFRRQFRKSSTCDISSDGILSNEINSEFTKSTPMNRIRHSGTRRFSLVKLEVPSGDSNSSTPGWKIFLKNRFFLFMFCNKDDSKTSSSPNLIQKLLFRQFSPKIRPYSMAISVSYHKKNFSIKLP